MSRALEISRRTLFAGALAGGTLSLVGCLQHPRLAGQPPYPPLLDHLVWLAEDLDVGCARFEDLSGIAPQYGGRHPSGTHNALVALGPNCYLEIAAPQPGASSDHPWIAAALARPEPHLYTYCMRPAGTLETLAQRAGAAGISVLGPSPGSRTLPDGRELRWRLLIPMVPRSQGTVPFFIDWLGSPHPAATAPRGANLIGFSIRRPATARMESHLSLLAPGLRAVESARPYLMAEIASPKGTFVLTG